MSHFIELGHRQLGFVSGPRVLRAAIERQVGFTTALSRHGIQMRAEHICEGDWSFESGVECARKLLRSRDRPTAIFASNDRRAAGILKMAAEAAIQVPQELSVAIAQTCAAAVNPCCDSSICGSTNANPPLHRREDRPNSS